METPAVESGKSVACGNCGRVYGPDDGIRLVRYPSTSILGLRSLFADKLNKVPCPACDATIDFEPAVVIIGAAPPTAYITGGDAISISQLEGVARGLRDLAAKDGYEIATETFDSQGDLKVAVFERLGRVAKAMTPLNAASVKGELDEFMAAHWRTITPEVFVASDVVTMIQHVAAAPDEARQQEGIAYFSKHAEGLGHLQAQTWWQLCHVQRANAAAPEPSLERDLARFVDEDAIFTRAVTAFEEAIQKYEPEGLRGTLVRYSMLAVVAQARKAQREPNPLEDEWTSHWMTLEFALRDHDADLAAMLEPYALSKEAVAGTLRRKTMFDVAAQRIAPSLDGQHAGDFARATDAVKSISEKAGYPDLLQDLWTSGIVFQISELQTSAQVIDALDMLVEHAKRNDPGAVLLLDPLMRLVSAELIASKDVQGVKDVFEHASRLASDDETRGDLEAWYGATLLRLHREQLFLEQVGVEERPWEAALSDTTKGRLWTERANALRASGRVKATLEWRKRVMPLYEDEPQGSNYRTAVRMLSVAERETGAPDRALALLLPLLEDKQSLDRVTVLETAAATWVRLGELKRASASLEEAIELAVGPHAHRKPHLEASLASLGHDASGSEVEQSLLEADREEWSNPATLLQECAAWLNLQARDHAISAKGEARYSDAIAALAEALKSGVIPPSIREHSYMVLAKIAEQADDDNAHELWGAAADPADALGLVPQPEVVIALAEISYRAGEVTSARAVLRALPGAFARDVERLDRIEVALDSLTNLRGRLNALTGYLIEKALHHDARVVAEFRRDRLHRATSRRNIEQDANDFIAGKLFAPIVEGGSAAVLEFLQVKGGLVPILTWQPPGENKVRSKQLDASDVDVFDLRDRIVNRLQSWVRGRPGDPFEVEDWQEFRRWLRACLADALPEASHLVVIESEGLEGIPFHVAVAPEWTCSYASSWISLSAALARETADAGRLSFAMVPAYADDAKVAESMRQAGDFLRQLADRVGRPFDVSIGAACDKDALSALLATSDVSFIACHGFLYEEGKEVAWVLAHRGGLPGKSGVLVQEDEATANHLSWREIEQLKSTPPLVVSAACSSGRALAAGLGDRIGLFQSLARRGTRTLVAPAWDVEAEVVLPMAAHALQLHLEDGMTLANAVRAACSSASRELPAWCAWPLTIEGAWR